MVKQLKPFEDFFAALEQSAAPTPSKPASVRRKKHSRPKGGSGSPRGPPGPEGAADMAPEDDSSIYGDALSPDEVVRARPSEGGKGAGRKGAVGPGPRRSYCAERGRRFAGRKAPPLPRPLHTSGNGGDGIGSPTRRVFEKLHNTFRFTPDLCVASLLRVQWGLQMCQETTEESRFEKIAHTFAAVEKGEDEGGRQVVGVGGGEGG